MNAIPLEEKSAACTLSDMEIFIFPALMYALVLANILSPRLWAWRDLDWFAGIRAMRPKKRLQRLRQHIMDNYTFNLDLETWGLTTQQTELARFAPFLAPDEIARSNALFGYQGDVYYYDIDIRRHFGLDTYSSDHHYASVEDFPKMPPQSVDFFRGERTVYVGGRTQLICRINPGTAEEDSYFYTVSDPAIISFDGEYVEGLAAAIRTRNIH